MTLMILLELEHACVCSSCDTNRHDHAWVGVNVCVRVQLQQHVDDGRLFFLVGACRFHTRMEAPIG